MQLWIKFYTFSGDVICITIHQRWRQCKEQRMLLVTITNEPRSFAQSVMSFLLMSHWLTVNVPPSVVSALQPCEDNLQPTVIWVLAAGYTKCD